MKIHFLPWTDLSSFCLNDLKNQGKNPTSLPGFIKMENDTVLWKIFKKCVVHACHVQIFFGGMKKQVSS